MPTIRAITALVLLTSEALAIELCVLPGVSGKTLIIYRVAGLVGLRLVGGRRASVAVGLAVSLSAGVL